MVEIGKVKGDETGSWNVVVIINCPCLHVMLIPLDSLAKANHFSNHR